MPVAWFVSDFWNDQLVAHDRQWIFLVLLGLLGSFGFIRMSTRLIRSPRVPWWPGSVVSDSGVHVHHLVFGIVLMMLAGTISFAGFATGVIYELCAVAFGIGMGLTIDEFALWVYLEDVYWKEQGRSSIDAAVLAIAFMGLVVIGVRPFDVDSNSTADAVASGVIIAMNLSFAAICLLKKRLWHGFIGFFVPFIAIYGGVRLGKPDSWWAKRRYGTRNPRKQERSEYRFRANRRTERFKQTLRDAIGGTPEDEYEAKVASRR